MHYISQLSQTEPSTAPATAETSVEQAQSSTAAAIQAQQYLVGQSQAATANGITPGGLAPQSQQAVPQYPPGVKVPEQAAPGATQAISAQGARPPSAAPQQMLPQQQPRPSVSSAFPGSLSDLVVSFENVKQKGQSLSCRAPGLVNSLVCQPLQHLIGCRTWTRCTSCWKGAIRACPSRRIPRSQYSCKIGFFTY